MLALKNLKDEMASQLQQQFNSIALSKSDLQHYFTQSSGIQNSSAQSSFTLSQLAQSKSVPSSSQEMANSSQNPESFTTADKFNDTKVYEEKIERLKTMRVNQ